MTDADRVREIFSLANFVRAIWIFAWRKLRKAFAKPVWWCRSECGSNMALFMAA